MERLTGFGDLPHQNWGCLKVPVGIGDVAMTEIRAERDDVAGDRLPLVSAGFQGPHGEAVSQVVDAGTSLAGRRSQSDRAREPQKGSNERAITRRSCSIGEE